ncbi:uncharacterized protein LOC135170979 [Diachasmimorpha longicaudata]|uniref:uncharacterized protein LOC135170979 n=1 Tax=Diachasmimorpha longicaudata TaxID=58733 RepID=UPI0030B8F1C4
MDPPFERQLRLDRLAMVQVSATLWRIPWVVRKIKAFFIRDYASEFNLPHVKYTIDFHQKKAWGLIIVSITTIKASCIPAFLKPPVMYLVEQMGMRIFEWLRSVAAKLLKYSTFEDYPRNIEYFIDNIEWTSLGTIDRIKVFKKRYNNPGSQKNIFMWYEACNYCLKDYARNVWAQMSPEAREETTEKVTTMLDDDFCLMGYWQSIIDVVPDLRQKLFNDRHRSVVARICNSRESIPVVMFKLAAHLGNEQAVKYFWNIMTKVERMGNALRGCEIILKRRCIFPFCEATFCKKCSDIFCFLLCQITPEENQQLITHELNKGYDPFGTWMLLLNWPWEDLFLMMVDRMWPVLSIFDCKFFINKFETTVFTVASHYSLRETSIYHKDVLYKVCLDSPRNLRPHFMSRYKQFMALEPDVTKTPEQSHIELLCREIQYRKFRLDMENEFR